MQVEPLKPYMAPRRRFPNASVWLTPHPTDTRSLHPSSGACLCATRAHGRREAQQLAGKAIPPGGDTTPEKPPSLALLLGKALWKIPADVVSRAPAQVQGTRRRPGAGLQTGAGRP